MDSSGKNTNLVGFWKHGTMASSRLEIKAVRIHCLDRTSTPSVSAGHILQQIYTHIMQLSCWKNPGKLVASHHVP